jgi:hypothetical protein
MEVVAAAPPPPATTTRADDGASPIIPRNPFFSPRCITTVVLLRRCSLARSSVAR